MEAKKRAIEIHERVTASVALHKRSEKELVEQFAELDRIRGYAYLGARNLYDYAMRIHKLSEPVALNIINVARKSNEVPEIRRAISEGKISVSKARKIVPVINAQNKDAWLDIAEHRSLREIERAVAQAKPALAVKETARFVMSDRLEVVLSLSDESFSKLKRVMDLESQRSRKAVPQGEAVVAALDAYLEKHDPLKKAERARAREVRKAAVSLDADSRVDSIDAAAPVPGQVTSGEPKSGSSAPGPTRQRISSSLRTLLDLRDGRQCTHRDENGTRCTERRWLDYHHVVAVSAGGENSAENMTTLCRGHHQLMHEHHARRAKKRIAGEESLIH